MHESNDRAIKDLPDESGIVAATSQMWLLHTASLGRLDKAA